MAGFQTLLGLGTGREPSTYLEILGPPPAAGTPPRPGRKTGITRVVPPLADDVRVRSVRSQLDKFGANWISRSRLTNIGIALPGHRLGLGL